MSSAELVQVLALFDAPEPVEPPPGLSADRRRTIRQAEAIRTGRHPLALVLAGVRLHPDAPRDATARDPLERVRSEVRCGSCVHRRTVSHGSRDYPKCELGDGYRNSHGAATDVRAWWPGCVDWQAS